MTHASICSGIDGPAMAAMWLGWENLFHADINEFTNTVLKYYYPDAESYTDIRTTDFRKWKGKVDVLTAGFPCQPFSVAGLRTGQDHDSYLWDETLWVVAEVRPCWFIGENVNGITSMVFPGEETEVGSKADLFGEESAIYERTDQYIIERICSDLEELGYEAYPVAFPACAVGAPHERMRCFFIAHSIGSGLQTEGAKQQTRRSTRTGEERDAPNSTCLNGHLSRYGTSKLSQFEKTAILGNIPKWQNFPTQSPVCDRNDGLSDRLSGITFSRWVSECLKSLGNAIVPQQIYEILRLIALLEQHN